MYPSWQYFPRNTLPPQWCAQFVTAILGVRTGIDSTHAAPESDQVLSHLAPALTALGYRVERSKRTEDRIRRPVLFGEQGVASLTYEIDAFHDELGIAVEVEAGRGAQNNADYRAINRASLLVDARYLALLMPKQYAFNSGGQPSSTPAYERTRAQLDAIYASQRPRLPCDGVLVAGD